jgi:hypothetical protein
MTLALCHAARDLSFRGSILNAEGHPGNFGTFQYLRDCTRHVAIKDNSPLNSEAAWTDLS